MYINPFWAGVLATILAELACFTVFIVVQICKYGEWEEIEDAHEKDNSEK